MQSRVVLVVCKQNIFEQTVPSIIRATGAVIPRAALDVTERAVSGAITGGRAVMETEQRAWWLRLLPTRTSS